MEIKLRTQFPKLLRRQGLLGLPTAEVGVAEGLFSAEILEWGVPRHYMVDTWASTPSLRGDVSSPQEWHDQNLADAILRVRPFGSKAVFLQGLSVEMARLVEDLSVGFVYLDACHDHDSVLEDLRAWTPKLVVGGVMAGHDYLNGSLGVRSAVAQFCAGEYAVKVLDEDREDHASFYFIKGRT